MDWECPVGHGLRRMRRGPSSQRLIRSSPQAEKSRILRVAMAMPCALAMACPIPTSLAGQTRRYAVAPVSPRASISVGRFSAQGKIGSRRGAEAQRRRGAEGRDLQPMQRCPEDVGPLATEGSQRASSRSDNTSRKGGRTPRRQARQGMLERQGHRSCSPVDHPPHLGHRLAPCLGAFCCARPRPPGNAGTPHQPRHPKPAFAFGEGRPTFCRWRLAARTRPTLSTGEPPRSLWL